MIWSNSGLIFSFLSPFSCFCNCLRLSMWRRSTALHALKCTVTVCGRLEVSHGGWDPEQNGQSRLDAECLPLYGFTSFFKRRSSREGDCITVSQTPCREPNNRSLILTMPSSYTVCSFTAYLPRAMFTGSHWNLSEM